jgi:uncharacterized protein
VSQTGQHPPAAPNQAPLFITAYGDGGFRIAGARLEGPVLLTFERILDWPADHRWSSDAPAFASFTPDVLAPLLTATPALEILVIGCGPALAVPPASLRAAAKARGVALESMDTGAACRTYNALIADGRRAGAALWPV